MIVTALHHLFISHSHPSCYAKAFVLMNAELGSEDPIVSESEEYRWCEGDLPSLWSL